MLLAPQKEEEEQEGEAAGTDREGEDSTTGARWHTDTAATGKHRKGILT